MKPGFALVNDQARTILAVDRTQTFALTKASAWTGSGQTITVADTGFDIGKVDDKHPAFKNCNVQVVPVGRPNLTYDSNGHGTHVSASTVGNATSTELGGNASTTAAGGKPAITVQGTAIGASLVLQSLLTPEGKLWDPDTKKGESLSGTLFQVAYDAPYNSRIHSNSWGPRWSTILDQFLNPGLQQYGPFSYNVGNSTEIDNFVNKNQDLVIVFAAGNDANDATKLDASSNRPTHQIGGTAAAKNCITVGASQSTRKYNGNTYLPSRTQASDTSAVPWFSSVGPTVEGRIKPDLVAPGTSILSARSRDPGLADDKFGDAGISADKQ